MFLTFSSILVLRVLALLIFNLSCFVLNLFIQICLWDSRLLLFSQVITFPLHASCSTILVALVYFHRLDNFCLPVTTGLKNKSFASSYYSEEKMGRILTCNQLKLSLTIPGNILLRILSHISSTCAHCWSLPCQSS